MNKETIVTSAFHVHRSKFSCSLAAALLSGLFEYPADYSGTTTMCQSVAAYFAKPDFSRGLVGPEVVTVLAGWIPDRSG
jgi:hypothetical protein